MTTAGGIEEDFIKCLSPMFIGDFTLKGKDLRLRGLNRTGNLVVPNDNYCVFEEWLQPILNSMADEQVSTVGHCIYIYTRVFGYCAAPDYLDPK